MRFLGEAPTHPSVAHPPTKISLGRSRACTAQGEASGKVSRFFLGPAPVPTPSFLGYAAAAEEGLIRFASKDCIYSVLLREARKHPGRPGRRDEGEKKPGTHGWCVYACPTPQSRACRTALCWESSCRNERSLATSTHHAHKSLGMELGTECVL